METRSHVFLLSSMQAERFTGLFLLYCGELFHMELFLLFISVLNAGVLSFLSNPLAPACSAPCWV